MNCHHLIPFARSNNSSKQIKQSVTRINPTVKSYANIYGTYVIRKRANRMYQKESSVTVNANSRCNDGFWYTRGIDKLLRVCVHRDNLIKQCTLKKDILINYALKNIQ